MYRVKRKKYIYGAVCAWSDEITFGNTIIYTSTTTTAKAANNTQSHSWMCTQMWIWLCSRPKTHMYKHSIEYESQCRTHSAAAAAMNWISCSFRFTHYSGHSVCVSFFSFSLFYIRVFCIRFPFFTHYQSVRSVCGLSALTDIRLYVRAFKVF